MANILIDTDSDDFLYLTKRIAEYSFDQIDDIVNIDVDNDMEVERDIMRTIIENIIQCFHEEYERDKESYQHLVDKALELDIT